MSMKRVIITICFFNKTERKKRCRNKTIKLIDYMSKKSQKNRCDTRCDRMRQ